MTAVLTLALAIGANAVVFSVLNALVLRPLSVPHAESLYMLERERRGNESVAGVSRLPRPAQRNRTFESLASYTIQGPVGLDTGGGRASVVWPYMISGNYFDSLGIQPYLGRFIHSSDEHGKNSVPYIVLSYAFWHTQFNDDRSVVGRAVEINKHPYTIVGVAPPNFRGTSFLCARYMGASRGPAADGRMGSAGESRISFHLGYRPFEAGVRPAAATSDLNTVAALLGNRIRRKTMA